MSDGEDNFDQVGGISQQDQVKLRRAWRQSPAVWRFVPGRGNPKHIRKWLGKQSRDDWHEIALNFDVDAEDLTPLQFIVGQADTDRATILTLILALDPLGHEEKKDANSTYCPHTVAPGQAGLLDDIVNGFDNGFYQTSQFKIGQSQSVFRRTKSAFQLRSDVSFWNLPSRAWLPLDNRSHNPDYHWDQAESCQRIPFDIWVRTKLRPN